MKTKTTSFRVDDDNGQILETITGIGRNKSEFINEAIRMHGPFLVKKFKQDHDRIISLEESNKSIKKALTEEATVKKAKTVPVKK